MPTAERLLRLYPRAWRARYGEEFLATAGPGELRPRVAFDVVMGAIDAWLSADAGNTTRACEPGAHGGGLPMLRSMMVCGRTSVRITLRDSLIGAGVMLAASLLLSLTGLAMKRAGWPVTAEVLNGLAFPASFLVSMPFWLTKGQPWRAQAVILGATVALLTAISYLATKT